MLQYTCMWSRQAHLKDSGIVGLREKKQKSIRDLVPINNEFFNVL